MIKKQLVLKLPTGIEKYNEISLKNNYQYKRSKCTLDLYNQCYHEHGSYHYHYY